MDEKMGNVETKGRFRRKRVTGKLGGADASCGKNAGRGGVTRLGLAGGLAWGLGVFGGGVKAHRGGGNPSG